MTTEFIDIFKNFIITKFRLDSSKHELLDNHLNIKNLETIRSDELFNPKDNRFDKLINKYITPVSDVNRLDFEPLVYAFVLYYEMKKDNSIRNFGNHPFNSNAFMIYFDGIFYKEWDILRQREISFWNMKNGSVGTEESSETDISEDEDIDSLDIKEIDREIFALEKRITNNGSYVQSERDELIITRFQIILEEYEISVLKNMYNEMKKINRKFTSNIIKNVIYVKQHYEQQK